MRHTITRLTERYTQQGAMRAVSALKPDELRRMLRGMNLPGWMTTPDVERTSWINGIITQLWPGVCGTAKAWVDANMDQLLKDSAPPWIRSIAMTRFSLGEIPPTVNGIKTFQDVGGNSNSIVVEFDYSWAGDQDVTVTIRPLPKYLRLPLPGKSQGGMGVLDKLDIFNLILIKVGMGRLSLSGRLRVTLTPLIPTPPFFGSVQVSLVDVPKFDFALDAYGGDLSLLPGLEGWVHKLLIDSAFRPYTMPDKYVIPMIDDVSLMQERPIGIISVEAIEARNVPRMDLLSKSDPYLELYTRTVKKWHTQVIDNNDAPVWDEKFGMLVHHSQQVLTAVLYDYDAFSADDEIGRITIPIESLEPGKTHDLWLEVLSPQQLRERERPTPKGGKGKKKGKVGDNRGVSRGSKLASEERVRGEGGDGDGDGDADGRPGSARSTPGGYTVGNPQSGKPPQRQDDVSNRGGSSPSLQGGRQPSARTPPPTDGERAEPRSSKGWPGGEPLGAHLDDSRETPRGGGGGSHASGSAVSNAPGPVGSPEASEPSAPGGGALGQLLRLGSLARARISSSAAWREGEGRGEGTPGRTTPRANSPRSPGMAGSVDANGRASPAASTPASGHSNLGRSDRDEEPEEPGGASAEPQDEGRKEGPSRLSVISSGVRGATSRANEKVKGGLGLKKKPCEIHLRIVYTRFDGEQVRDIQRKYNDGQSLEDCLASVDPNLRSTLTGGVLYVRIIKARDLAKTPFARNVGLRSVRALAVFADVTKKTSEISGNRSEYPFDQELEWVVLGDRIERDARIFVELWDVRFKNYFLGSCSIPFKEVQGGAGIRGTYPLVGGHSKGKGSVVLECRWLSALQAAFA